MQIQDWLDAGYKRFNRVQHYRPYAEFGLQKRIQDSNGIKYFITVFVYSYEDKLSFAPDVQFSASEFTANIEFILYEGMTIAKLERIVEEFWTVRDFAYYEKYQDY